MINHPSQVTKYMTVDRLSSVGPDNEIIGWMNEIQSKVTKDH